VAEEDPERLDRELIELLNELRVALPGVQVLFAFLLTVPFSSRWTKVTELQEDVFFATFLCTAASSVLLIAPSTYHRLRWRAHDKERMLEVANQLAIAGTAFLAGGIVGAIFLITDVLFAVRTAAGVSAGAAVVLVWFWYALALKRRVEDRT
jgi:hypothetical protein